MTAKPAQRLPKFRIHKHTQQAYVELSGKRVYLGLHDTAEAKRRYHALVADWIACGRQLRVEPDQITLKELIARYWLFAEQYYRDADGHVSRELTNIRDALRPVKELYAPTPAKEFGPRALRAVREAMVTAGLCRRSINCRIGRIKRMFKWAAAEELVPGAVHHALLAVDGLRRGRSAARDSDPVCPVAIEHVNAVRPFVSRQVWAMIELQRLTGARGGEIVILRPRDVDTTHAIWIYAPAFHKSAHRGHERRIYLGPLAQEVLRPFLLRPASDFCFSPAEADIERRSALHAKRRTPAQYGNAPGTNRRENAKRKPGARYTVNSYRQAIVRAAASANIPAWHPHQLRHSAATLLRREFGLETARVILGHRSAAVTTMYAEADQQKAVEAMSRVG